MMRAIQFQFESHRSAIDTAEECIERVAVARDASSVRVLGKVTYLQQRSEPAPGLGSEFVDMDAIEEQWAVDQVASSQLKEAMAWAAGKLYPGEIESIRALRMRRGLTQAQLGAAIGVQQPYIARIECGVANLQLDTLRRLASALGVDLNTLDRAIPSGDPSVQT